MRQKSNCPWWLSAFKLKKEQKVARGQDRHWSHSFDLYSIIASIILAGQSMKKPKLSRSNPQGCHPAEKEDSGREEVPTDEVPQAERKAVVHSIQDWKLKKGPP